MLRVSLTLSAAAVLSGCVHPRLASAQLVTPADAFLYAQLAQNAYHKPGNQFDVGSDARLVYSYPENVDEAVTGNSLNDIFGLAFDVFEAPKSQGRTETIFAFRGTEGGFDLTSCDFRYGNLKLTQQRLATDLVGRYLKQRPTEPSNLVFVGHSLGGGIARHVSMRFQGGRVFAFDTSPRFQAPEGYKPSEDQTRRYAINAAGEVLKITRLFGIEPTQIYWKVDCNLKGGAIDKHSMRSLAECLTKRAAEQTIDPIEAGPDAVRKARESIDRNRWAFGQPPAPDVDTPKYHCPS